MPRLASTLANARAAAEPRLNPATINTTSAFGLACFAALTSWTIGL